MVDMKILVGGAKKQYLYGNHTITTERKPVVAGNSHRKMEVKSRERPSSTQQCQNTTNPTSKSNATANGIGVITPTEDETAQMNDQNAPPPPPPPKRSSSNSYGLRTLKAIVPSPPSNNANTRVVSTKSVDIIEIRDECKKRIKKVCQQFSLLPQSSFSSQRIGLHHVVNLVCASLSNELPNSINPNYHLSDTPTFEHAKPWLVGILPLLRGPQIFMATRKFILQRIEDLYQAEGVQWLTCPARMEILTLNQLKMIKIHLISWRAILISHKYSNLLGQYANSVWKRFKIDYSAHFRDGRDYLVLHKLTEHYVHVVANKLASLKMCPLVPISAKDHTSETTECSLGNTMAFKAIILNYLGKIQYDLIPFAKNISTVADTILQRFQSNYINLMDHHITSSTVREVLDDLEIDNNFLTYQNQIFVVSVNQAALLSSPALTINNASSIPATTTASVPASKPVVVKSMAVTIEEKSSMIEDTPTSPVVSTSNTAVDDTTNVITTNNAVPSSPAQNPLVPKTSLFRAASSISAVSEMKGTFPLLLSSPFEEEVQQDDKKKTDTVVDNVPAAVNGIKTNNQQDEFEDKNDDDDDEDDDDDYDDSSVDITMKDNHDKRSDERNNSHDDGDGNNEDSSDCDIEESSRATSITDKKKWIYSTSKVVGSRVYAEFTNGDYYWGRIGDVTTIGKLRQNRYLVHFEDGDVLSDIAENKIFTEVEYKEIFEIDPPEPEEFGKESEGRRSTRRKRKNESDIITRFRKNAKTEMNWKGSSSSQSSSHSKPKPLGFMETVDKRGGKRNNSSSSKIGSRRNSAITADKKEIQDTPSSSVVGKKYSSYYSLRKLHRKRCKKCVFCKKADCKLCSSCLSSKTGYPKLMCLQKICCIIPIERKLQTAVGFPPGWMFTFDNTMNTSTRSISRFDNKTEGLIIFDPDGKKYFSLESARKSLEGKVEDQEILSQQFLAHIGAVSYKSDPDHFLLGKGYCHEWLDRNGRNFHVFGIIVKCVKSTNASTGDIFTVQYSKESRSLVNSISELFGQAVPENEEIPAALAWGGCVAFERNRKNRIPRGNGSVYRSIDRNMSCQSWVTPDMRREELVDGGDGVLLPKLTVTMRGFKLVFSVKKSSIPNSGYGVFLKCTSLLHEGNGKSDGVTAFDIQAGELLDLGVYAPFRLEDKKHAVVYQLKKYIYSMDCDEWCFKATEEDYIYDLTDDNSGKVHAEALRHIPMYVNEPISSKNPHSIQVDFDPEGNVHYLFGIAYNGIWEDYREKVRQLNLTGNGQEVEVFVDYGMYYENVRIRKGYSSLPENVQKRGLKKMEKVENELLISFEHCSEVEISMCLDFLRYKLLCNYTTTSTNSDKKMDGEIRNRALKVTKQIKTKIEELLHGGKKKVEIDNEKSHTKLKELYSLVEQVSDILEKVPFHSNSLSSSLSLQKELDQLRKKSKVVGKLC